MLEDYRSYLTNVRNNLIQCGVEFPINPLNTYSELFHLGLQLDEVLWYYHILAVSGSEDALVRCMFSLRGYYKEKMRQVFYEEFRSSLPDYKKISTMFTLLQGYNSKIEELDLDDEIDLFNEINEGTTPEENDGNETEDSDLDNLIALEDIQENEGPQELFSPNSFLSRVSSISPAAKGNNELEDFVPIDCNEYVSHGVYLDELVFDEVEDSSAKSSEGNEDSKEYVSHGVYLDDLWETEDEDVFESPEDTVEYDENGFEISSDEDVFEDEDAFEDNVEYDENGFEVTDDDVKYDENGFEVVDDDFEVESEDDVEYDENGFEITNEEEDEIEYDEDGFEISEEDDNVEYDENGFELSDEEENGIKYDEDGFEILEDEDISEGDDSIEYDEDGFEIVNEEDDGIEYDENGFEISDENEEDGVEYDENGFEITVEEDESIPPRVNSVAPTVSETQIPTQSRVSSTREKDLTDYIQDAVNTTLTKGKRFIHKEIKKMKDSNKD